MIFVFLPLYKYLLSEIKMTNDLRSISFLNRWHDFELIYMDQKYYISSQILAAISPVMRDLITKQKIFTYKMPSIPGNINDLLDIFSGKDILINDTNVLFLYFCGCCFQIQELIYETSDALITIQDRNEILVLISSLKEKDIDITNLCQFISANIDKFIRLDKFKSIDASIAAQIIESPAMNCIDSCALFTYIVNRFHEAPDDFSRILQTVCKQYLNPITLSILLKSPYIDINKFKQSLIPILIAESNSSAPSPSSEYTLINYEFGKETSGLFDYFRTHHILSTSVDISASSTFNQEFAVTNLLNNDFSHYYSSEKGPIEFVEIHILKGTLSPTHYTLMSCEAGQRNLAPTSWTFSGSNDGKNWILLDSKYNDNSLCYDRKAVVYPIVKESWKSFSYFQFAQYDSGGIKNKRLLLAGIELFGAYSPNTSP